VSLNVDDDDSKVLHTSINASNSNRWKSISFSINISLREITMETTKKSVEKSTTWILNISNSNIKQLNTYLIFRVIVCL